MDAWTRGQRDFEWVEPTGGGVGLVRFAPHLDVDKECFYETLLAEHGTYVGPGHWFELDDRHFRLGFGWPTVTEWAGSPRCRGGLMSTAESAASAARPAS